MRSHVSQEEVAGYSAVMNSLVERSKDLFTATERDLIRRELGMRFGQLPSPADGLFLRTWRGGPQSGQPKLPLTVQSMLERGCVEVRMDGRWPRACFTKAGLAALRELARDRRQLDPVRYAHVRQELGLETKTEANATGESAATMPMRPPAVPEWPDDDE